tara:strand:- start:194 stop:415 length:222 start_codon:yes stop_codon:yes gene_type:complete
VAAIHRVVRVDLVVVEQVVSIAKLDMVEVVEVILEAVEVHGHPQVGLVAAVGHILTLVIYPFHITLTRRLMVK